MKHLIINTGIIWARSLRHNCIFHSSLLNRLEIEFMSWWKWSYTIGHIYILHIRLIFALGANSSLQFIHESFIGDEGRLRFATLLWCLTEHIDIVTVNASLTLIQRLLMLLCISRMWLCKQLRFILILIAHLIVYFLNIKLILSFSFAAMRDISFLIGATEEFARIFGCFFTRLDVTIIIQCNIFITVYWWWRSNLPLLILLSFILSTQWVVGQ